AGDMAVDGTKQFIAGERFGEVLLRTDDAATRLVEQTVLRAQHDHWRRTELRVVLDERARLVAVQTRHHDVDENDGRFLVGNFGQRLEAVDGGKHLAPFFLEQGFRRAADGLGVFNHHDLQTSQAVRSYIQV